MLSSEDSLQKEDLAGSFCPESRNDHQERFPWVLESAGDRDSWTGRMQNFDDGSAYGILTAVPGRSDAGSGTRPTLL